MGDFVYQKTEGKPPSSRSIDMSIKGNLYTAMIYGMGLQKEEDMAARGDKSITVLSSMAGFASMPLQCDYKASKWGVHGFFRSVRFNLIAPYFVRTPLTESWCLTWRRSASNWQTLAML